MTVIKMLKIRGSTVKQCLRCKGNSESANRFFKRMNQQYNQSIEQSINPALENYYKRPDILPHLLPPGSKRRNDPVDLYNARIEADYSNQKLVFLAPQACFSRWISRFFFSDFKNLTKTSIGRLTGLDCAGPIFDQCGPAARNPFSDRILRLWSI